jgi:arabinogalactan oligomer/maltooligosaccharide transport system substrate-binding protein
MNVKHCMLGVMLIIMSMVAACSEHGLVLWHAYSGDERTALEQSVARYNQRHPEAPLLAVAVPYAGMADKLASAIPHGNGPDIFIYPHDRLGDWVSAGTIEPIEFWLDDSVLQRFEPAALAAMVDRGSLWALPVAVKTAAMFYRKDHFATPPRSLAELQMQTASASPRGEYPLGYVNADLYGHAPFLHAFGGRALDDHDQLAIDSAAAVHAAQFARELVTNRTVPQNLDGPGMASLFNNGKVYAVFSGPWFVADITPGLAWGIAPMPTIDVEGKATPLQPYLGADALVMSSRAHNKAAAYAAMAELTDDDSAILRAKTARQIVPNKRAYLDPDVARDTVLAVFQAQLAHALPMPKSPTMRMIWTPYKTALAEILAGSVEPAKALRSVEHEIAGYVAHDQAGATP